MLKAAKEVLLTGEFRLIEHVNVGFVLVQFYGQVNALHD